MSGATRVVIADDHPVFRDGLRAALTAQPGHEVVAEAANGIDAVEAALRLKPDVVLMDIGLPELDGLSATRRILGHDPGIRVLVLTMHEDDATVLAAMRAGARGYLVKGDAGSTVLRAVAAVVAGEAVLGPSVAPRLAAMFETAAPLVPPLALGDLTARERDALILVARGLRNSEIAAQMHVAPKTVRNYITRIFAKLQVSTRTEAVIVARDAGLR